MPALPTAAAAPQPAAALARAVAGTPPEEPPAAAGQENGPHPRAIRDEEADRARAPASAPGVDALAERPGAQGCPLGLRRCGAEGGNGVSAELLRRGALLALDWSAIAGAAPDAGIVSTCGEAMALEAAHQAEIAALDRNGAYLGDPTPEQQAAHAAALAKSRRAHEIVGLL